jgi:hypothetical protein
LYHSTNFEVAMGKTALPNVYYRCAVPESALNVGENTVWFKGDLPNGDGDADHWDYRITVTRS